MGSKTQKHQTCSAGWGGPQVRDGRCSLIQVTKRVLLHRMLQGSCEDACLQSSAKQRPAFAHWQPGGRPCANSAGVISYQNRFQAFGRAVKTFVDCWVLVQVTLMHSRGPPQVQKPRSLQR